MGDILKQKLEKHYLAFNKTKISPDPLQFLHNFKKPEDIELVGLISSTFAYGNVKQINNTLEKIFNILGSHPNNNLLRMNKREIFKNFEGIKHRFYTNDDVKKFFTVLNKILLKEGSIKNIFLKYYDENDDNVKQIINYFSTHMLKQFNDVSPGIKFMFPMPEKGSACKRINLFLRWMVREDELDFGLWKEIKKNQLLIPVDTHISRICQKLKLTSKKNVSWNMAEEITNNLKKFDIEDPVKYDFAICHIGMRKMEF
ncbi:MAG: TIGR02757 family protein [Syntrophothermus sp.]